MLRDNIFLEVQKLIDTLNLVQDFHPTGGVSARTLTVWLLLFISALQRKSITTFVMVDLIPLYPSDHWLYYLAFLELKNHPNFFAEWN